MKEQERRERAVREKVLAELKTLEKNTGFKINEAFLETGSYMQLADSLLHFASREHDKRTAIEIFSVGINIGKLAQKVRKVNHAE